MSVESAMQYLLNEVLCMLFLCYFNRYFSTIFNIHTHSLSPLSLKDSKIIFNRTSSDPIGK